MYSDRLTFGSLFAGIGGFDLGFERAGMICKWQVEIDLFCQKVLAKHWPDVKRFEDVRRCGKHNLETVDVICGGFPCQPHSKAGKRKASKDERDMWPEFARIIGEIRPRWVVAENVPGILSSENGRYFGSVLRDLAEMGYDAEWYCISASAIGAPHRRERVFTVAHTSGHGLFSIREQDIGTEKDGKNKTKWSKNRTIFKVGYESKTICSGQWKIRPKAERMVDGIPNQLDRLKSLGNAVVPQVAELIASYIVEIEKETIHLNPEYRP